MSQSNPLFALAAVLSLALTFVYFSNLTELGCKILGVNVKIMHWFAILVDIAVILAVGVPETLLQKAGIFFLLFAGEMVFAAPFSSWIGGSHLSQQLHS